MQPTVISAATLPLQTASRLPALQRQQSALHVADASPRSLRKAARRWRQSLSNAWRSGSATLVFGQVSHSLNAIAHRDYSIQAAGIEVWLFDNRREVSSPGGLLPELSLDELLRLRRVHCSRNPRLMRTLVDLGLTRDQGEGIPRIFAEMADAFLPNPRIESSLRNVSVVLGNTTLSEDDRVFVSRIGGEDLSDEEFRALLQTHRHTQVDNASLRSLMGLDTLGASQILRRLRDRGLLELHARGSQSYYTLALRLRLRDAADRGEQVPDRGELQSDRGELGPDRGEQLAPSLLVRPSPLLGIPLAWG